MLLILILTTFSSEAGYWVWVSLVHRNGHLSALKKNGICKSEMQVKDDSKKKKIEDGKENYWIIIILCALLDFVSSIIPVGVLECYTLKHRLESAKEPQTSMGAFKNSEDVQS